MARGINKVILIGNLGADPETRYSQGGNAVTKFRIATSENWRDRQSGEQQVTSVQEQSRAWTLRGWPSRGRLVSTGGQVDDRRIDRGPWYRALGEVPTPGLLGPI